MIEGCSRKPPCPRLLYAVGVGLSPGVYADYDEANRFMGAGHGARMQRFDNEADALAFVGRYSKGRITQGALPTIPAPLEGIKRIAVETTWHETSRVPIDLTVTGSITFLEKMGFLWDSCPLSFNYKTGKKIVTQTKRHKSSDSGIYVHCAESGISVIDIDGMTSHSMALLNLLAGECNMVSLTNKGIHLVFKHSPHLPTGYSNTEACIDTRSGGKDILFVQPSRYDCPQGRIKYTWHRVPKDNNLLPCPPRIIDWIRRLAAKKAIRTGEQQKIPQTPRDPLPPEPRARSPSPYQREAATPEVSQRSKDDEMEVHREARSESCPEQNTGQMREAGTPQREPSLLQPPPQDHEEHLWHDATATAAPEVRTMRALDKSIIIMTLNIGGYAHIMDEKGNPHALFLSLVGTLSQPSAIALTDIRLTPQYPNETHSNIWRNFCAGMKASGYVTHGICGPNGVAIFSAGLTDYSVPPPDQSQDALELHIRRIRPQDPTARLIFRAVYFPHAPCDTHKIYPTLTRMAILASLKQNISITTGDTNAEAANKRTYGQRLTMACHVRVMTPCTGKPTRGKDGNLVGGGHAQAIWTTHPSIIVPNSPRSLKDFGSLSDHHQPLVYEISLTNAIRGEGPATANLRKQMRVLKKGMSASDAADRMTTAARDGGMPALKQTMLLITEVPESKKYDKKSTQRTNALKDSERIIAKRENIMKAAEQQQHKVNKAVLQAAIKNSPSLKQNIFQKQNTPLPTIKDISERYAKVLQSMSWVKVPCNLAEYFDEVAEIFAQVDARVKRDMEADYTEQEAREGREYLKHTKTYCDFEARLAHLMGPTAVAEVAKEFTAWQLEISLEVTRKILGVPTNKRHSETDAEKILHKLLRPIGLAELLRAWFAICQNRRLVQILRQVAPERMFCSIPNREGHDMTLSLLSMVTLARNSPLWMIQGDISKCWDFLQHEGISYLDKMLGMKTPIFHTMAQQIRETLIDVYAAEGKPARAHQDAGGPQGAQTVPSLAMLILTPLMVKLQQHAEGSSKDKEELVKLLRDAFNFADDFFVTSDDLRDAIERFMLAQYLCELVGWKLNLVAVACNERAQMFAKSQARSLPDGASLSSSGENLTIGKVTCKIEATVRPLQACVHLREGKTPCANTKCTACPKPHTEKLHEECRSRVINNLAAQPLPIVDKAQFANQNLVASLMYAAYSCQRQAAALFELETEIRHTIFGHGYGGYVEGAHLPAPKGGLGLADSMRLLAVDTAATLERAIARQGVASRLLIEVRQTAGWPHPILSALRGELPKKRHATIQPSHPFATFELHRDLLVRQSPQRNTAIAFRFTVKREQKKQLLVHITAVAWATDHEAPELVYRVKRKGTNERMLKMVLLAQVLEREALKGCGVTLSHELPGDMLARVDALRKERRAMHYEGKVFESVVVRTRVEARDHKPLPNDIDGTLYAEENLIPESYPISAKVAGCNYVTGSLRDNSITKLKQLQEEEYRERNQIREILYPPSYAEQVDLEYSAASAGILHGIHYESELTFTQSNKLVRLKTGTELKSSEHVVCAQCSDNTKVTLSHIAWHVSQETLHEVADSLEAVAPKCKTCGTPACMCKKTGLKFGPLDRSNLHPSMVFGFVRKDFLTAPKHPSDIKEYLKLMKKIAATYALVGLAEYKKCNPKCEQDSTPDTLPPQLAVDESKKYLYQAYADASLRETEEGPWIVGLGGFIQEGEGNVIAHFAIRKEVPRGTSPTHAEHLASLALANMTLHKRVQNVALLADNNAVPNQIDGLWCTKGLMISVIREKTHHILARIGHGYLWTSRVFNGVADQLAKDAIEGRVTRHDWDIDAEIDEILAWAGAGS